jgi:hypothetical protein
VDAGPERILEKTVEPESPAWQDVGLDVAKLAGRRVWLIIAHVSEREPSVAFWKRLEVRVE